MSEDFQGIRKTTFSNFPYFFSYKTINSNILPKYFDYFFDK